MRLVVKTTANYKCVYEVIRWTDSLGPRVSDEPELDHYFRRKTTGFVESSTVDKSKGLLGDQELYGIFFL